MLLVPAVVNEQTSYRQAWVRSHRQIRKLIPLAQELDVVIALEEVWNKFLLSPLEFGRYVDEFRSPWVKVWFDIGDVVLYGYPQDWIRTLGPRIADLHAKGFRHTGNCHQWVNIAGGDIDWPQVRKALAETGYRGTVITELKGGDEAYLHNVSDRLSKYVPGASPLALPTWNFGFPPGVCNNSGPVIGPLPANIAPAALGILPSAGYSAESLAP